MRTLPSADKMIAKASPLLPPLPGAHLVSGCFCTEPRLSGRKLAQESSEAYRRVADVEIRLLVWKL
jgi:hypothetical protein